MKPSASPSRRSSDTALTRLAVLEALVETSDDAIFSHDDRGLVTSWNQSAARIFGLGAREVLGRRGASLFPEHLRRAVEMVLETIAAGDRVQHFETEIRRKDGMPVPIALSGAPVRDADGTIIGAVLIARDITEQRIAQATLAEIDARSRASEAQAHVGAWLWDVGSDVVQWTDELHRIHAVDPLDFEGTLDAHIERVHPDDRERFRAMLTNAAASGRPFAEEHRIRRPDGEVRWVYTRAEPTVGSDGTVVGVRGLTEDVERRAAQSRTTR
jgi:PAS domain S-box-containing protein